MIAVLCASIRGIEMLREMLSDAEAARASERCRKRIRLAVESYAGGVVGDDGERITVVFSSSQEAFQAAVVIQQRIQILPAMYGIKLAVRVGICSAHVEHGKHHLPGKPEELAAKLAGMAHAGQILFCVDQARQQEMAVGGGLAVRALPELSLAWDGTALGVCEIDWHSGRALATSRQAARTLDGGKRLVVRHDGREIVLDGDKALLTIGRGPECHLQLRGPRASREHARIERRDNEFFIVDQSRNGTYLLLDGRHELHLRQREMVLRGAGQLSFGASPATSGIDRAYFRA